MQKPKADKSTVKRLLKYLFEYKKRFTSVLIFIIISAVSGVAGSMFLRILIDDYINPMLLKSDTDFSGLAVTVGIMGLIYVIGIVCTFLYNRFMISISQGILKKYVTRCFHICRDFL